MLFYRCAVLLRFGIAAGLAIVAGAIALVADRRSKAGGGTNSPVQGTRQAPAQLHRGDFTRPETPWLVAIFTSAFCGGCANMTQKVAVLESDSVAICEIEYGEHKDLHERYNIDAVPLVVIADQSGVVRRSFFGATSATDLWAAVAELRNA